VNLQTALGLGGKGVISIVGAGGKTTLMYALARELTAAGRRVLTTTTTKILPPAPDESPATIIARSPREIIEKASLLLEYYAHLTIASEQLPENRKLRGLEFSVIERISTSNLFDFIIIEADGAAGRSLKVCASHEPVVYPFSDRVVGLAGLDVVGNPLTEERVFRSALFSGITGVKIADAITEESVSKALIHDLSLISVTKPDSEIIAFLNKADSIERRRSGERIGGLLKKDGGALFQRIVVGTLSGEPFIHMCARADTR